MSSWFVIPLNAQPWTTGRIGVGKKGGKFRGTLSPDAQLQTFQEALREFMEDAEPLPPGKYMLTFYVWRQLEEYDGETKHVVKHVVDATNMQKAIEDALQGNLIGNDRDVAEIRTVVVEQERTTVPFVVIKADSWPGLDPDEIPDHIWSQMDEKAVELSFEEMTAQAHSYHEGEDIF